MSTDETMNHVKYHFAVPARDPEMQHFQIAVELFERHVIDPRERFRLIQFLRCRYDGMPEEWRDSTDAPF